MEISLNSFIEQRTLSQGATPLATPTAMKEPPSSDEKKDDDDAFAEDPDLPFRLLKAIEKRGEALERVENEIMEEIVRLQIDRTIIERMLGGAAQKP